MSQLQEASPRAGASGVSAGPAPSADFYDYQIANSYRSMTGVGYFTRTPSSAGNRKTYTISFWFKRTLLTASGQFDIFCNAQESSTTNYTDSIRFNDANNLQIALKGTLSGNLVTTRVFRDTSAWMHIVCAVDTTQGTASNRVKLYINGEQETDFSTETYPSQDYQGGWCNDREHALGRFTGASYTTIGNFYMANFALVDNSQLAPTSFGTSKNGVWIPDDLSGLTWGTTGTWVRFESSSDLGNDSSGNNNDWTNNSVATHDQMTDTPTFGSSNGGNFMTYNGAWVGSNNSLAEGNLQSTGSAAGNTSGTFGMITGKWYWECKASTVSSFGPTFGIGQSGIGNTDGQYYIITWQTAAGQIYGGGGDPVGMGTITVNSTGVTTLSSGDILSFWLDCDNGKLWIGKNGTIPNSGDPANGTNPQASWSSIPDARFFTPTCQNISSGVGILNAGQNPSFNGTQTAGTYTDKNNYGLFVYDPSATDFIACCAANLPTSTSISPAVTSDDYPQKLFGAKLYTGNGGTNVITGLGFQPDVVWGKSRSNTQDHFLADSTNGTGKDLIPNSNVAQQTENGVTAFGTDGWTMGSIYNANAYTYVGWTWRANGGTETTNNTGTQTSYTQTDPSGGFSIVRYAGTGSSMTIGHGLSVEPKLTIVKDKDASVNWIVYTKVINGSLDYFFLNTTDAVGDSGLTGPNSSIWNFNSASSYSNTSGRNYIMYNFTDIEGYCKVGTYVGTGSSTDNAFIYLGFRPAFIMIKGISTNGWNIHDNATSPFNLADTVLQPNTSGAELSNYNIDMLSNGFKVYDADGDLGTSGNTYIYLAFAKNPFQFATAR